MSSIREIRCVNMQVALVDEEDWERLCRYTWYAASIGVHRKDHAGKTIYLHREVMNAPEGMHVGFRDENKLNCIKANLYLFPPGRGPATLARLRDQEAQQSSSSSTQQR